MARIWMCILTGLFLWGSVVTAKAAEVVVFCPGAVRAVVTELSKDFTKETGNAIKFVSGTAGAMQQKAAAGEPGDVVMVTAGGMDDLVKKGAVVAGSPVNLGKVGVGVAVRSGAKKPDVSTPEALKKVLLDAKSLTYANPSGGAQSGIHFAKVLQQLGIADQVKGKTTLESGGPVGLAKVAKGEIELGVAQMSEIAEVKGVSAAGPLPPSLQNKLTFTAGILAKSKSPEAASSFIRFITSPSAKAKFKAGGFETE